MYVGDSQDAQDDMVRAPASGRQFFFRCVREKLAMPRGIHSESTSKFVYRKSGGTEHEKSYL